MKIYSKQHNFVLSTDIKDFNINVVSRPQSISRPQLIPTSITYVTQVYFGVPGATILLVPQMWFMGTQNVEGFKAVSLFGQGLLTMWTKLTLSFSDNVQKKVYVGIVDLEDLIIATNDNVTSLDEQVLPFSLKTFFVGYMNDKLKIDFVPTSYLYELIFEGYDIRQSPIVAEVYGIPITNILPTNIQPLVYVESSAYSTLTYVLMNYQLYGFSSLLSETSELLSSSALYIYDVYYNYAKYFNKATGQIQ